MRGQALLAAAAMAAALAAAPQASAQDGYYRGRDYEAQRCEQVRNSRTAAGAVLGGILGAVVGNNVAGNGARGEGAVLGGVVGAVAGGAIARNSGDCDRERHPDRYGRYGDDAPYHDDRYGRDEDLLGGPTPAGYGGRQACRYEDVWVGHGRNRHIEQVWVCDDPRSGYGRY